MKKLLVVVLFLALGLLPVLVEAAIVGNWHLNENTGTTAYDSSGNNLDGTLKPSASEPMWVTGKYGSALSFDGTNDYVEIADNASLNIIQGTWEAWIKFAQKPSDAGHAMNIVAKAEQYWIHATTSDEIQVKVGVGATRYIASTAINYIQTGVWYHVAGTYDGEDLKLYINGTLVNTNSAPSGNIDGGSAILAIGTWSSLADYFKGTADEVRVWNTVLTENQIRQSMNSPVPVIVTASRTTPDCVELNVEQSWTITLRVDVYDDENDVNNVVVKDGMGADLDGIVTACASTAKKGKGNMGATMVTWNAGNFTAVGSATCDVTVTTGWNKRWHEFTTIEDDHPLDGGASASYDFDDIDNFWPYPAGPVTVDVEEDCP